ncbi:PPE family protein [Mycobacterium genavense]|uniref:PPE family protein n=1 Tax=Mycobacterium genavense TaxID=36812 RepID=UPI003CCBB424
MSSPPEVHSLLLNAGPGLGPMLAAAAEWLRLGEQYARTATELAAILADTRAGSWQGPTADRYVAAHLPYLRWLDATAAECATTAAAQQAAAVAYTAAVTAMPTAEELALNHALHAALLVTNFFGINTIPIALNEADYARMWVQAAETMAVYQATSAIAVATAPPACPAPQILGTDARMDDMGSGTATSGMDMGPPTSPTGLINQIKWLIQQIVEQLEFLIKWIFDPSTFTPKQIVQALIHTLWTMVTQLILDLILHPGTGNFFLVLAYASMALVHASQLVMPYLLPLLAPTSLLTVAGLGGLGALGALPLPSVIPPAPPMGAEPLAAADRPAAVTAAPAAATATLNTAPTSPPPAGLPPYVVCPAPEFGGELDPHAGAATACAAQYSSARQHTVAAAESATVDRKRARDKDRAHRYEYLDVAPRPRRTWMSPCFPACRAPAGWDAPAPSRPKVKPEGSSTA